MNKLENYIEDLTLQEKTETNGGFLGLILAGAATVAAVYTVAMAASYYVGYQDAHNDCGCDYESN